MNISGIGSYPKSVSPSSIGTVTGASASSFAQVFAATDGTTAQGGSASSKQPVDFTHMMRSELRDLISSKIKSGEITLDGTEPFVTMMAPTQAVGESANADDPPTDFMQAMQGRMAFAQQRGDTSWLKCLQSAFDTMQHYQGQSRSVDPSA